ncbi:VPLPA-CTERM sorting domain-containing protein [Ectothiorhodospira haloalkaliphila]|nr:VPLPA-CTERM sorting domain-containing protein [Ectothiorhodospira haloalkaliphila]
MRKILIRFMVLVLAGMGAGSLQAAPIVGNLSVEFKGVPQGFQAGSTTGDIHEPRLKTHAAEDGWVSGVHAGMYRMTLGTGRDSVPEEDVFWGQDGDFNAFCIQTWQVLASSQNLRNDYSLWSLKGYLGSSIHGSDEQWAEATFSEISALFARSNLVDEDAGSIALGATAETDAAFQLALWAIVNEWEVSDADKLSFSGFGDAVHNDVELWVGETRNANQVAASLDFYVLSSATSQNLLVWKTATATEVPLPATLWLMLAGILGVGLARRS